jgi:hypothetical protein
LILDNHIPFNSGNRECRTISEHTLLTLATGNAELRACRSCKTEKTGGGGGL